MTVKWNNSFQNCSWIRHKYSLTWTVLSIYLLFFIINETTGSTLENTRVILHYCFLNVFKFHRDILLIYVIKQYINIVSLINGWKMFSKRIYTFLFFRLKIQFNNITQLKNKMYYVVFLFHLISVNNIYKAIKL